MRRFRPRIRPSLIDDRRGVTVVEFAIVAPVMMMLLMGLGDLLYQAYVQSVLDGAVQKAGRDSTIQGASDNLSTIDGKVVTMVSSLVKNPTQSCATTPAPPSWCSTRKSYSTYGNVKPEAFTDTNRNGRRDTGECFDDINGNKTWDADPGMDGQGGADDVAVYSFRLTYPRVFPVAGLLGWPNYQTITSRTSLKNQPYATQTTTTVTAVCT